MKIITNYTVLIKILSFIGILFWLSAFILPLDFLHRFLGSTRWPGFVSIYLLPALGWPLLALSIWQKRYAYCWLALAFIFSFFLSLGLAYIFGAGA
ncbi:hypothetical protein ACMZ6Z_08205 [Streptococcus pluranimalium]|uniref:hypothetical protein n=1 Tax=Streptococcus pluranimalium TaxID=82348 RepID=UPI0039FD9657